jgi:hypothetical protein
MRTLMFYGAASLVYIGLGIYNQNYLYSYFEGLAFLCLFVVGLPALVKRFRR